MSYLSLIQKATARQKANIILAAADKMQPKMKKAFLDAVDTVKGNITMSALVKALENQNISEAMRVVGIDEFIPLLNGKVTEPGKSFKDIWVTTFEGGAIAAASVLPEKVSSAISFNLLNPRSVDFINNEAQVAIVEITNVTRSAVRSVIRRGFEEEITPIKSSREIRELVGLTEKQSVVVTNFRRQLEQRLNAPIGPDGSIQRLTQAASRRLSATEQAVVRRHMKTGYLNQAQIDKMVNRYNESLINRRAQNIARTETVTAANAGQQELWNQAVDQRALSTSTKKKWVVTPDKRLRANHAAIPGMNPDGIRIKGYFETPIGPARMPPPPGDPVNCRCGMVLVDSTIQPGKDLGRVRLPLRHPRIPKHEKGIPLMGVVDDMQPCFFTPSIIQKRKPMSCSDYSQDIQGNWVFKGKKLSKTEVKRIEAMRIPPAWKNVVVSADKTAKVQVVGMDKVGRWQYRYSEAHSATKAREKFDRVKSFSREMPGIRKNMEVGVKAGDPRALLLRLENQTAIRAGSTADFKAKKKAYGLTTLQNEHVKIKGNKIILDFVAKEGIPAHYEIKDSVLAGWLTERKASTKIGEKLFADIPANKLNHYIKEISGGKRYTVKDFRTYHGTRIAFDELKPFAGKELTKKEKNKVIKDVSVKVSGFLKNTPTMAKKSYIDPTVWDVIGGL